MPLDLSSRDAGGAMGGPISVEALSWWFWIKAGIGFGFGAGIVLLMGMALWARILWPIYLRLSLESLF